VKRDIRIEQILLDAKYQLRFGSCFCSGDLQAIGHVLKLVDGFALKLGDIHGKTSLRRRLDRRSRAGEGSS
jgi:hypothetical protein